ncbi:MAG TPA: class I SAM-dependent methyltransferase [Actinomycetes bacterium]|nr:class I SAM-dependent methyltransferase [Actinomycetes bacterium]
MAFDDAASYDQFMGRYSKPLADQFVKLLDLRSGLDALDVGCGPGALTQVLVDDLGADHVQAIDPSASFVQAARQRMPGVDVDEGVAEDLPYRADQFDVVVAQLVVHFMRDPVTALGEMARVTKPGGIVGATVWDHAGTGGPLTLFWEGVRRIHPEEPGESALAGTGEGHLLELFGAAGMNDTSHRVLTVLVRHESFDEWWTPFTLGVGPAGEYVGKLDARERDRLKEECQALIPHVPFDVTAAAWCVTARV